MTRRGIGPVDTLWLRMDRPENQMVIESLMLLEDLPDHDRFLALLRERLLDRYPVFHQRAHSGRLPLLPPHWQDDPDFDVERHVHRVTLPPPGDVGALQALISGHLGRPLPRDRPLWEIHLVDGLESGAAIYTRLHHSLADGVALTQVVLAMTDPSPEGEPPPDVPGPQRRDGAPLGAARDVARAAVGVTRAGAMLLPGRLVGTAGLARQAAGVGLKLLLTTNPGTSLGGRVHVDKRVLWAPPIPLAPVVEAGHRTGTTVNDLLVAALAGAVSRYLVDHDGVAVDLTTMVPVDLRPPGLPLPRELGNRFALVLLTLPSGLSTPFARLAETKRRMDAIKRSPEAAVTFGLIRALGLTGPDLERRLVDFFADKAIGVTTNVVGPRTTRYLAGRRVTAMLGWAPESGQQPLGTAIFTYDGSVYVGFKVDVEVVEHPEHLLQAYVEEVEELCRLGGRPARGRRRH